MGIMENGIHVVVGGQFGSEAKGHVAAQLAARAGSPLVIRTGGPNAGHTVYSQSGQVHKLRQLPTAAVSNSNASLAIAAGALVDLDLVQKETLETNRMVFIDRSATILESKHREAEEEDSHLFNWSTREGIGAARADRIHRTARTFRDSDARHSMLPSDVALLASFFLNAGNVVIIEAAQGYGLGLHTEYYPKTTSADCRAIDALADVGISPWAFPDHQVHVWLVVRPYPIRVAGESGPLRGETSWEELGLPEERTTVTNKIRRVGTWDPKLVKDAIRANGGPSQNVRVVLTMVDQICPSVKGAKTWDELTDQINDLDREEMAGWVGLIESLGAQVAAFGTGPDTMVFS